jgi:hypothetical protein
VIHGAQAGKASPPQWLTFQVLDWILWEAKFCGPVGEDRYVWGKEKRD